MSTTDENIVTVKEMISGNCSITIKEVADDVEVMRQWREVICLKRTELWKNQSWILHQDNASAHTSMFVHEFLAKNKIITMLHPPYTPVLATTDFFLFPKLKSPMKGNRFAKIEEIKEKRNQEILALKKSVLQKCFEGVEKMLA